MRSKGFFFFPGMRGTLFPPTAGSPPTLCPQHTRMKVTPEKLQKVALTLGVLFIQIFVQNLIHHSFLTWLCLTSIEKQASARLINHSAEEKICRRRHRVNDRTLTSTGFRRAKTSGKQMKHWLWRFYRILKFRKLENTFNLLALLHERN